MKKTLITGRFRVMLFGSVFAEVSFPGLLTFFNISLKIVL